MARKKFFSKLFRKQTKEQQAALTLVRSHAIDSSSHSSIAKMFAKHFAGGVDYYNVGHSNYRSDLFDVLARLGNTRINVMIHDVIPKEFPEFHDPSKVSRFSQKLVLASKYADRVICVSNAAQDSVRTALDELGHVPEFVMAHIGLSPISAKYAAFPKEIDLSRPYFVIVGTIEPRKNHALLLDVWDKLPEDGPQLVICGSRGWMNATLFTRLDKRKPNIIELSGLSDQTLAAVISESQGLLFPSLAEGFGLPPIEALSLGVPVYCSDLPVFFEILGDAVVCLPKTHYESWLRVVTNPSEANVNREKIDKFVPPTWDNHFNIVLS